MSADKTEAENIYAAKIIKKDKLTPYKRSSRQTLQNPSLLIVRGELHVKAWKQVVEDLKHTEDNMAIKDRKLH